MAKYKIDLDALAATFAVAKANTDALGIGLLMALKGFPCPPAFSTVAPYLRGVTASGLFEAKLGALMGHDVHVHAPAYTAEEMPEIRRVCTHVVFNSLAQLKAFGPETAAAGCHVGLRINPGFSFADCLKYDPCCPDSRFGVLPEEFRAFLADPANAEAVASLDGLHVHALCEGYSEAYATLVERFSGQLKAFLAVRPLALKWINLGGGETINQPGYATEQAIAAMKGLKALGAFEVFIEPSEYLVRYSGTIEAEVLDVIHREKDIAVLDVSLVCHATDAILYDMKSEILAPAQKKGGRKTILGTVSCLAGDVIGEYEFARPLQVGAKVVIGGMGCYSFAQQSWFNGIRHPDLVMVSKEKGEETAISWTFDDYLKEFVRG